RHHLVSGDVTKRLNQSVGVCVRGDATHSMLLDMRIDLWRRGEDQTESSLNEIEELVGQVIQLAQRLQREHEHSQVVLIELAGEGVGWYWIMDCHRGDGLRPLANLLEMPAGYLKQVQVQRETVPEPLRGVNEFHDVALWIRSAAV